jgi:hypothetical protein
MLWRYYDAELGILPFANGRQQMRVFPFKDFPLSLL